MIGKWMVCASGALLACVGSAANAQLLGVGDSAPALPIDGWVKGDAVSSFEPGQVYVVEFWATWCGPCKKSIPHLTKLQKEFGDDVTVIGVAGSERAEGDAALKGLKDFVNKQGDGMGYTVAFDSDREAVNAYLAAAGVNTIPTAFVVDGEGKIAWMGFPDEGLNTAVKKAVEKGGAQADRPYALMVGDPAPSLSIAEWVKGEPVTEFNREQVYVVEFWATWCGPCIAGMPHVSELQKEYKDDGVTVIGVNIWDDPANVAPFMKDRGEKPSGDTLMQYTVAIEKKLDANADPSNSDNGVMSTQWMAAAGRNGIPSAFIVDQQGRVAWVGHPMEMDEPLEKVIAGTWDIREEAEKAALRAGAEAKADKIMREAQEARIAGDWDAAIKAIDRLIELDPETYGSMAQQKYQVLLLEKKDYSAAYAYGRELAEGPGKDEPMLLNTIAWFIVDPGNRPAKQDLDLAMSTAQRASELTKFENPMILDTLAAVYFDKGDLDSALKWQEKAVELSANEPQFIEELTQRLEQYKAAKK